ncbi:MAG TPA: hypothetical protein DCM38_01120 [Gammaproteobacteria bacterium]|nr:hypothetical protein [Gammaproteobacteria bacterium]
MSSKPATPFFKEFAGLLIIGLISFLALAIFLFRSSFFFTESGYLYHYQNFINQKVEVYEGPGLYLKIPFSFTVTRYAQDWTVNFGIAYSGHQIRKKGPIQVTFADTYTAKIPVTFRYKLPRHEEKIKRIHREFRSFDELIDSLLIKTSRDIVVMTATQYTGEEFFLGGFNQFKASLEDQLRNGIYQTERRQIEIEQMTLAPVGLDQEDSTQLRKAKTLVWKTIPRLGPSGKRLRLENQLNVYGIELVYVALGDPLPEEQLEQLLADKKRLVAERIKAVQEQETAKEQAKTVQLRGEVERTKSRQEALKEKDLAIIAKQRDVEVAEKQKDKEIIDYQKAKQLAEIDKTKDLAIAKAEQEIEKVNKAKELVIAQANLAIQKANFEAAQFEAKAILEMGIAEAKVLKAKYAARIPDIYRAEIQKEIAQIIYPNIKDMKITMPRNVVNLGDKNPNLQTNLDVLSSFATIGVMEGLEKKALDQLPLTTD